MTDPTSTPSSTPPSSGDTPGIDRPLNGLEQIIEAAMEDPVHWRAFEAMLASVDLVVVPEGAFAASVDLSQPGTRTLRSDQQMDLRGVTMDDGVIAAAVFTDPRRMQAIWGDLPWIAISARHLLRLFHDRPVILNPGSPRALLFQIEDVAALLAATDAVAQTQGRPTGTVQLGTPEHEPTLLMEQFRAAFGPANGVTAAWLARAHWAETNRWGWMLDVRTDRPMDEIKAIVSRAVTGVNFGEETLDVSVETPGGKDGAGIRLI